MQTPVVLMTPVSQVQNFSLLNNFREVRHKNNVYYIPNTPIHQEFEFGALSDSEIEFDIDQAPLSLDELD